MLDLADALKAEPPGAGAIKVRDIKVGETRTGGNRVVARKTFTMQGLRRITLWGATAAGALAVAALASRTPAGVERVALILHHAPTTQVATRSLDADTQTQRLAEAVRGLAANDEQLKTRLAAVEHDMDDVTGSITKQLQGGQCEPARRGRPKRGGHGGADRVIGRAGRRRRSAAELRFRAGHDSTVGRRRAAGNAADRIRRRYRQRPDA